MPVVAVCAETVRLPFRSGLLRSRPMGLRHLHLLPLALLASGGCTLGLDFSPSVLLPALDAGPDGGFDAGSTGDARANGARFDALPVDTNTGDRVAIVESAGDVGRADVGEPDAGADPTHCGGTGSGGEPCCAGGRCNLGYVCLTGTCARCGGNRDVCCPGGRCDAPRACVEGTCR